MTPSDWDAKLPAKARGKKGQFGVLRVNLDSPIISQNVLKHKRCSSPKCFRCVPGLAHLFKLIWEAHGRRWKATESPWKYFIFLNTLPRPTQCLLLPKLPLGDLGNVAKVSEWGHWRLILLYAIVVCPRRGDKGVLKCILYKTSLCRAVHVQGGGGGRSTSNDPLPSTQKWAVSARKRPTMSMLPPRASWLKTDSFSENAVGPWLCTSA